MVEIGLAVSPPMLPTAALIGVENADSVELYRLLNQALLIREGVSGLPSINAFLNTPRSSDIILLS